MSDFQMNVELLSRLDIMIQNFLDRPNAENLFESIRVASNGLQQENLLQLAMDGPDVNWEVLKKTYEILAKNYYSKTINIGSYPQHTVHTAFKTGDY